MLGGVVVILFGLFIAGFLKMDFLLREKKLHISNKPANLLGTYFVGMAFAAGWTPCIGPILGTILLYLQSSLMLVTALNSHIGYDKASKIC
ncbi:Cytochrome c-type biogenesis protein CcdA, partial [Candidatus Magnetobacterium bavaricum]